MNQLINPVPSAVQSDTGSLLWVVTSYYNPAGYQRRLQNFKLFRRFLNAPLLVVELSGSDRFQLGSDDGDVVLQLHGEDRLWQKERLINLGAKALPEHVQYVAWVDCDVLFMDPNWVQRAFLTPKIAIVTQPPAKLRMTTQAFIETSPYAELPAVDLLFVDSLHTAEQASFDHRAFLPLLSEQAVVLFHDSITSRESTIYGDDNRYNYSVCDYITTLKQSGEYQVFDIPVTDGLTLVRKAQ